MDDKFMETLKSLSKDILDEQQRPDTASIGRAHINTNSQPTINIRAPSAFGMRPSSSSLRGGIRGVTDDYLSSSTSSDQVTTLASYRPESAAFQMTNNRPMTGGGGGRAILPSARPLGGRQPSARARSSFRRFDDSMESSSYIPDLDEVQEEDLTMTVASAPSYELQRMASLTELDAELSQTKALSVVDGVNLRKLCKYLVPEKELIEHDEYWNWDRLYTEIMSSPELAHLVRFQRRNSEDPTDMDSMMTFK